jgi:hypothetical protein
MDRCLRAQGGGRIQDKEPLGTIIELSDLGHRRPDERGGMQLTLKNGAESRL